MAAIVSEQRRSPLSRPFLVAIRELSNPVPPHAEPTRVDLTLADDSALALALQASHPRAPAIVFGRMAPIVRRTLLRILGPGSDVEDLVQDAFVLLFRRVETLRDPAMLKSFVLGIAVRVARSEIRRRRVRRWMGLSAGPELLDTRSVPDNADSREALARFYAILEQVNVRDRTAFVLHHIEGLDVATIATALRSSVPTVRRCLARSWKRVVLLSSKDPALVAYVACLEGEGSTNHVAP